MEEFFDAYSNQDSSKRKAELIDIGIDSSSVIEISLQDRDSDKHNSNIETKVDYSVSDLSTMTNHDVSNEYSNIVVEHTKFFKNIYQDTVNMLLTDTHSVSSPKTMLMQTAETVTLAYIHKLEFNHSEIFTIQGSGFSYLFIEESILSLVHGTRMVDLPFNHNIKIEAEVILNYLKIILAMTFGLFCKSVDAVPSMPDFLLPLQNHLALTCYEKELLVSMYHQLNKQLSHVCFSEGDTDDPATTNDVSEKRETAEHSRTLLKKKAKGKPLTLDSADLEETLKIYRPSTIFSTKVPDVPTKHAVLAKPNSPRKKISDVSVLKTDIAATSPKTDQTKDVLLDIPPDSSCLKTSAVSVLETDNVAATPPKTDQTKDELFDIPLDSSQLKTSDVSVLETDDVAATPPKTDQAKHELLDIPPDSSRLKTSDVSVLETNIAATPPKTDQTKDKLLDIPPDSSQLKTSDVSVLETDIAATPPKIDQTKDELLDIPLDSSRLKTSDVSVLETNIAVATPKTDHQTKDELLGIFTDSPKEDNELSRKFRNPDVLLNAAELYNANDFEGMESDLRHYSANMCEMEVHEKIIFTFSIGLALYEQGKHHHAIQEFNEAITLLQQYGIPDEQSVVHLYIGEAEFAQCHYAEAVESLKQSANFHECAHGTGRSIVQRLYALKQSSRCYKLKRLAIALRSNNCISESEEKFEQAIKCEDATDTELIGCHSGLGNLYHNNGDHPAAITEYKTAIELAKKENDQLTLCWLYGNIGNSCLSLRKKHEGIEYLKLALKCTKESEPTPSSISRALNNLGTGYQAVGHIETAEDYYDQALCQGIYGEDTNGQARAYGNIGNLCMLRKDYERAIPHYTEVFSITNDSSVMYVAYHNRGCSYYELAETMREKLCKDKIIHFQFKAYGPHAAACVKSENKMPSNKILEMYKHGLTDFEKIILNHESKFSTAMISPKSLDLFVCLFESNSKTFSRAQDCAYCLGDYHHAMLLAEQCCSRTLAELMLRRRETPLKHPLRSPLTLDQVVSIMRLQEPNVPVVMLSWTGNRLLGWILVYDGKEVTMDTFEQKPSEDLFEGKSLDTYLQYCLGQLLSGDLELHGSKSEHGNGIVESSRVEMEEEGMTEENKKEKELLNLPPIIKLFKLVAKPLERIVTSIDCSKLVHSKRKLVFITDGTTKLIPFSSLGELNDTHLFGDKYTIRFMPSLLALGIMSQTPPVVIPIPSDKTDICIVGDPTTPPFTVKKQEFMLSSLPHAKEEAEWVGHYMRAKPLLQNEPTKSVVTSRLKNAVLIHIASHGSASQGFLVLAGTTYDTQATVSTKLSKAMIQDADEVLLYASDVASLSLKAGLVVLSSCDSGRGVIKGDDIQGMTRAFLVAGAQSVMTSLWKVPDKSARFFMQFFYRYLLDGLTSSEALSKASCSIRAFDEFSSMIHWSGYQITGKDVTIQPIVSNEERKMKKLVGKECSPFPRLEIISSLRAALIEEQSSDIQIVCGSEDVGLSEPIIDFITQYPIQFPGGIVWINGSDKDLLDAQCLIIPKVIQKNEHSLIIIDTHSPELMEEALIKIQDYSQSSVIMTFPCVSGKHLDAQIGTRKRLLTSYDLSALTDLQVTQRLVYHINCSHHLSTGSDEQKALFYLTSLCFGSPFITQMMTGLIDEYISKYDCPNEGIKQTCNELKSTISQMNLQMKRDSDDDDDESNNNNDDHDDGDNSDGGSDDDGDNDDGDNNDGGSDDDGDNSDGGSDDGGTTTHGLFSIIVSAILDCHIIERFISIPSIVLLKCLSLFGTLPIPQSVINAISEQIVARSSTQHSVLPCEVWGDLCTLSLLQRYPSLTIPRHNTLATHLYFVPVPILDCVWETTLTSIDDSVSKFVCGEIVNLAMDRLISRSLCSDSPVVDCLYLPELIKNVHRHVPMLNMNELGTIALAIRDHWFI